MATGETNVAIEATAIEATTTNSVVLKRNSDDVGWKYGVLVDPLNKEKVRCLFCGHTSSGGIYCLKQHVAHVGTSVVNCTKQTEEAKTTSIPSSAINNDEFMQMCEAIGQFGPGLQPPSQDHLRGVLLSEEYERTKSLVKEHDAEKIKNGCSIMTDAWSDRKMRSIMNLVTNCSVGTTFLGSKEMSDVSHTAEVIFELVDKAIEEVGEEEVVQVVTDNASNNMAAKNLFVCQKAKHILDFLWFSYNQFDAARNWEPTKVQESS
ncbi:hAT transposon superfamily protein [Striga hermonthica]|uniref:HAT transposon superfamily protein n=1 Tax=Striga hermonthica TaxID=68872 RepID=A0A9N7N0U3_STRHE|nr:hAT transposon superfamily protein [Striga hermonthica]